MANAPIPPLFCSTPPPIDDDDADVSPQNDGDFGDFSNAYQDSVSDYIENDVNDEFNDFSSSVPAYFEATNNVKITIPDLFPTTPSIPPNDINCDTKLSMHSENVESEKNKLEHLTKTTSLSSHSEQQQNSFANSMSTETKSLDKLTDSIILEDENGHDTSFGDFQFNEINQVNKDDSGRSSQSERLFQDVNEANVEKPKNIAPLANVVVLEDVPDDESDDERHSPRNRNNFLHCTEDSENFFALQPVNSSDNIENVCNINNTINMKNKEFEIQKIESVETPANIDSAANVEIPSEKEVEAFEKDDLVYDSNTMSSINVVKNDESEDEFANFQDFSTSDNVQSEWKASFEKPKVELTKESDENLNESNDFSNGDDDDDFGDFSEAPIAATPATSQASSKATTTPSIPQNIETHLKTMLEVIFPKSTTISDSEVNTLQHYQRTKNCFELAPVESAKALNYQWIGSNMRHSLIKSLGIDSRNIFLTEKWNPSMPRFAANLSFDPLQPLKPTTVPLQPEVVSSSNQKTAVPVAEFDWQTSGLVNPLDASHVHTLLLDVDQLVVVANLDIINLDSSSSSYCSQSSPSRALMATTLTTTTTTAATTTTSIIENKMQQNAISTGDDCIDGFGNNGITFNNAFNGDNLQMNNNTEFTFATNTATDINLNAFGTNQTTSCDTATIIDLHDTDNVSLLSTIYNDDMLSNNCKIIHSHYFNKNNNIEHHINNTITNNIAKNTSHDAFNVIDTMCFDTTSTTITATATTITASSNLLLLPTTSVAFTNHLQFDNLHQTVTVAVPSTSNPITPPITTTTITTTTPTNKFNDFTNIAHHFEQMKMTSTTIPTTKTTTMFTSSKSMHLNSVYRDSRSKAEMATQSADASNTESSASNVIDNDNSNNTNDDDTSNASSTYASAKTPAIVASTTSAALSSIIAGSGHIDAGLGTNDKKHDGDDDVVSENIDVEYFECSHELQDENESNQGIVENVKELEIMSDKASEVSNSNSTPICENKNISSIETTIFEAKNLSDVHFESVAISRSTFAGPLKETHIFTPTKIEQLEEMQATVTATTAASMTTTTGTPQKVFPIDFDYEKAAAGIIIDETVVRKEYRDIEYNPGFSLATEAQTTTITTSTPCEHETTPPTLTVPGDEFDDEFTDFQSVPPPAPAPTVVTPKPLGLSASTSGAAATANGMILSPAILLPQAISIESKQPKIEWGDSAASIDPDELARIEQLFPQEKFSSRSNSRKSTPTHSALPTNSLSISASIANQQQQQQQQNSADDDDWSDFVSVPMPATTANTSIRNTFNTTQQQSPFRNQLKKNLPPTNNDDEWSDFVSSAPSIPQHFRASSASFGLPQFNSASWQNANFYNNPLSIYHRNHLNAVPNATPTKLQQNNNNSNHNNNNHNNNNNYSFHNHGSSSNNNFQQQQQHQQAQYLSTKQQQQQQKLSTIPQQLQQQQQIQIMQDFSTSPVPVAAAAIPSTYRPNIMPGQSTSTTNATGATPAAFQVGSAKVAPTVSLIPDLGFVAPAMPVHTAIINALPKPSKTASPRK